MPRPLPRPQSEAARLYDAFGEAAHAVTPSPVPLAAIERAGRARRRRRAAALVIGCGLLLTPMTAVAVRAAFPEHSVRERDGVAVRPAPPADPGLTPVQVVAPGHRIEAGAGVEMWLTDQGKHWSTPGTGHQFRSVVDGNVDPRHPAVGLSAEPSGERCFLSGVYTGTDDVGRVVVSTEAVRSPPPWCGWPARLAGARGTRMSHSARILSSTGSPSTTSAGRRSRL